MIAIPSNPPSTASSSSSRTTDAPAPKPLKATQSLHGDFLEKSIPTWLTDVTAQRRQAFKDAPAALPAWYQDATPAQRAALNDSYKASVRAQNMLDKSMSRFEQAEVFARPLLIKALKDEYQLQVDIDKTLLCLRRPIEVGIQATELASFEILKLSLLEAALHNFEASECEEGAYHHTSGFMVATDTAETFESVSVALTVSQFMSLCRRLDIGKQYQDYLQEFFHPADVVVQGVLRERFIASQKATMRAAAEQALLQKDIEPADYTMIRSVIDGEMNPWMGNRQVWFKDLGLMRKRLTGCVVFVISEKYRYSDELIVYIPHDPQHPFKRYNHQQMREEFKRLLTARDEPLAGGAQPTPYQRFLSQFLPVDQRPDYFSQFTRKAADSPKDAWSTLRSPWVAFIQAISGTSVFTRIKQLPPERGVKMEPEPDPYIAPSAVGRRGHGLWAANEDLWLYLFTQNRAKVLADARSHAVPSDDVEVKARDARLAHLLQIGLLGLNMVSMFVPVLGEVMMVVMAGQLMYETLEGAIEWSEGDRRAARDHLIDVAENLAQIAVMAGVGAGVRKFSSAKAVPVIEQLEPVQLPSGNTRLWKPDLGAYESTIALPDSPGPNPQGQHVLDGKTYIRQAGKVYEQYYDSSLGKWRLRHPNDPDAWQPVLESNGNGAWRSTLERPLEWDRLTLLRRMGHATEVFSDAELLRAADISGVSDGALRKMHLDHAPPPPELAQAMRLLKADADAALVVEQLRGERPIDELYLYTLPLITEMPLWPQNRVLEVFDGESLSGSSVRYGAARRFRDVGVKPPIRTSRADILGGKLPAHILASLEEAEINRLLGKLVARTPEARLQEFNKRIANYANTRQAAIFESIYKGTDPIAPEVAGLQKECPGLGESAAQAVLTHAHAGELQALRSGQRAPLRLLEEARWYARQTRRVTAYAGLRSENVASADSRRLALHTLEQLPGWPDNLRIEVREDHDAGTLLDSIGSETASEKKYLIKKGAQFQAFNERGEALNSLPEHGDNFYPSIMHALPDEARRSLGVPAVGQSVQLREKIIRHADLHKAEAPALLEPQVKWIKPPVRVSDTLIGYPASGRGPGLSPNLIARTRDIYPQLTNEQARGYLLEQYRAGNDDRAIFQLLLSRRQEWAQLEATLDEWSGLTRVPAWARSEWNYKVRTAQALKDCWRNAPIAAHLPGADQLHLVLYDPLPALTANFDHVRELSIAGDGITDTDADAFLERFGRLEKLSLGERGSLFGSYMGREQSLTTLPLAVTRMPSLKNLKFRTTAAAMAADLPTRLRMLTAVEELHLDLSRGTGVTANLDLTPLRRLRKLRIDAPGMVQWPDFVQELPELERLDLTQTAISSIPQALYTGHEKLWAGLSLDWSNFAHEDFKPAYEYVKNYRGVWGHLLDLDLMVRQYCAGELEFLTGRRGNINRLPERIMSLWNTPETRLKAVELLRLEHAGIFRQLYLPTTSDGLRTATLAPIWETLPNLAVVRELEHNWAAAVRERYGLRREAQVPTPGNPNGVAPLESGEVFKLFDDGHFGDEPSISELPSLPAGTFSHVKTVSLDHLNVPAAQMRAFLQAFSGARTVEITGCNLTEVPFGPSDFAQLTRLDLSHNLIGTTPEVQSQIDALYKLDFLDLRENQLTDLNVAALKKLELLDLSSNRLQAWPAGAETLPRLQWLDLRENPISTLPEHVLADDRVMLKTNLTQSSLSAEGAAALKTAQRRIETAIGLPDDTLKQFEIYPSGPRSVGDARVPRTALAFAHEFLLPLRPLAPVAEGAADIASRLQDVNPLLSTEQAQQCLARLRSEGLSDAQIDARLTVWRDSDEALTRELNGWIFTRAIPWNRGDKSKHRSFLAMKVRDCWAEGLTRHSEHSGSTLDLTGLNTGDLPRLSKVFSPVRTLNLTGVEFSAQSFNEFCAAFPEVTTLVLNGNALDTLPDAVGGLSGLERLELSGNKLATGESLYTQAGGNRLRWLDLSHNQLEEFSASAFSRLETLKLDHNGLDSWPDGVLELPHLRALDLTGNNISVFPDRLLDGSHRELVAGTVLSENTLTLNSLRQLRDYSAANANRDVMGYSRAHLDREIDLRLRGADSEPGSGSDGDSDDSDGFGGGGVGGRVDVHAQVEAIEAIANPAQNVAAPAMETWLTFTPADVRAARQALWAQLARQANHDAFFHLLSTLPDTLEFRLSGADLTHRVWQVIQAATENAELREQLFVNAETHDTCLDGRILSFSELEARVYEYNTLRDIPQHRPEQRGRALLNLTRRLFRLERVDRLAEAAAINQDRAEVRLQYRIGMTSGWPDGLELPGQPAHMLYGTPIRGQVLINARASVLADEASPAFLEDLISRDYWVRYLEDRHSEVFEALKLEESRRHGAVEDAYPDLSSPEYLDAMGVLEVELPATRMEKLKELSRTELESLSSPGSGAPQPRPSSPQPGPSSRP